METCQKRKSFFRERLNLADGFFKAEFEASANVKVTADVELSAEEASADAELTADLEASADIKKPSESEVT